MKIIYGIGNMRKGSKKTILALGVFDGLHRGHQALIKAAVKRARKIKGQAVVMTFDPHPVHVLHPKSYLPMIASVPYRLKLIEDLGVDKSIVVRFTKRFSRLTPQQFVRRYIVERLQPKEIYVGDDFRFGQNRCGTLDMFQALGEKFGFTIGIMHTVKTGKAKIGSSMIRQLIASGKLKQASRLLGRGVSIMGQVVKGDKRGKTLGYPTANVNVNNAVIPPIGVYAVKIILYNQTFYGMANIGQRPSFKSISNKINVEVHIFDFNGNLYGKTIIIEFVKRIRRERIFPSKEKLIAQLKKDHINSLSILQAEQS